MFYAIAVLLLSLALVFISDVVSFVAAIAPVRSTLARWDRFWDSHQGLVDRILENVISAFSALLF